MLKVYYRSGCGSSRKFLCWAAQHNVSVAPRGVVSITREDMIHLLSLTTQGIKEVVKGRSSHNKEIMDKLQFLDSLSFNEGVDYLLRNTYLLKTPIVLDRQKLMIGYDREEIRQFLPRVYRRLR